MMEYKTCSLKVSLMYQTPLNFGKLLYDTTTYVETKTRLVIRIMFVVGRNQQRHSVRVVEAITTRIFRESCCGEHAVARFYLYGDWQTLVRENHGSIQLELRSEQRPLAFFWKHGAV